MTFKCGQLLLVEFQFTNNVGSKIRPVLVVSEDRFNRGQDVVVVPISSRCDPNDQFSIIISDTDPDFPATRLKMSSAIKWSKPFTISGTLVQRKLGVVSGPTLTRVQDSICKLFRAHSP
jgi:mRNA interferase MazF